jgi:hypothetical protein
VCVCGEHTVPRARQDLPMYPVLICMSMQHAQHKFRVYNFKFSIVHNLCPTALREGKVTMRWGARAAALAVVIASGASSDSWVASSVTARRHTSDTAGTHPPPSASLHTDTPTTDATSLVLLKHSADGLRWLEDEWHAVTDPSNPERYRRFATQAEVLAHLAPSLDDVDEVERWLAVEGCVQSLDCACGR